ncbi:MAG: hypothetical protein JNM77_09960 [Pseudonocardia sp.]|nr:hypothetical protein [Pseudonocardia sp.]
MTPQIPLHQILRQKRGVKVVAGTTYSMAGVSGFGRGLILREPLLGAETKYSSLTPLGVGDVVYSKVKAFEGAITVVPPTGHGRFVSPEFPVFTVADSTDPAYLHHLLAWPGFTAQLRTKSSGIGARRERVDPGRLLGIEVPLPDLLEQRRLARYLENVRERTEKSVASRTDPWGAIEHALRQLPWNTPLNTVMRADIEEVRLDPDKRYRQLGVSGKEFHTFSIADDIDLNFIQAIIRSSAFEERLRAKSVGLGARRERVDAQRFLSIHVPLPALDVQRSIGRAAEQAARIRAVQSRSRGLADALLPAARNEVFSALR